MSIKTWIDEYYPAEADALEKSGASDLELVDHALKKWPGLSTENLERHDLRCGENRIWGSDGKLFVVDFSTCALCQRFEDSEDSCPECPVTTATGKPCYDCSGESEYDPFSDWIVTGDVEPMLEALRWARRWCVRQEKRDG